MSGKRNIARTLTLLLFFVIIIVVILVIFAYFSGLLGLVGGSTKNVQISGVFSVEGAAGPTGTLAFSITNLSPTPITGVTFSCPAQFADPTCSALALHTDGIALSTSNPLGDKQTASGAATVTAASGATFTAGNPYTIGITIKFADGTTQTYSELLNAQG